MLPESPTPPPTFDLCAPTPSGGDWRSRPPDPLDWSPVADAMEQAALDARDPALFDLSQIVSNAVAEHNTNRDGQGCEVCDLGSLDRCPLWVQTQRILLAWLLGRP